jgi:predicted flap endonuclease-1-like 5' DNA nuclease
MKKLITLLALAVGAGAVIAYLTREQMLPAPETSHEPPPKLRPTPTPDEAAPPETADDLTEVKGIGPTYAARLAAMSISTRSALASADPHEVAEAVGTSPATVKAWQADVTR